MRHPISLALCLIGAATLTACGGRGQNDAEAKRAIQSVNVVDESNLNDLLLTSGDPAEAVSYFSTASAAQPERLDLKRGLAKSLVRAKQPTQAIAVWSQIVAAPDATNDDRIGLTDALIRSNEWGRAEQQLNQIPPTFESFDRYRLEAMVADSKKDWKKADSFYEIASGLTSTPANVLNNWGFSKLSRGDYAGAERLFGEALTYDSGMFTAKNNLVLARGAQRKYDLPVIPMTQTERAQLLYTLGLAAVKHGDITVGKGLLQDAVETHPQYFEAAARSLAALGG
ncbi:MAG: tetratricopeptide repeat protein [Microgenomates group bacterium]|jgi:Flp pilus assembly protein TadD